MDELGSYPRINYSDNKQYTQNPDQHGSWFGLAISGLKFLINNQNNNNINHNLTQSQASTTNNTTSTAPSKHHNNTATPKQQQKLHILGPSVFKKQLYDIPEYQSTAANKRNNKIKDKSFKTNARLTKQALQQFNGNFSNYWNQRSSLHSHDYDETSNAGSVHTNQSHQSYTNNTTKTDGAPSTIHQTEEYHPSMTSSQIIHPTQDKQVPKLEHSRSFPLLHSAEYIQNFQQFSKDIMIPRDNNDNNNNYDEEGSQCNYIPSPPPISNTPEVFGNNGMLLTNIKNVHAIKSWESINSSNIGSVHSFGDDDIANSPESDVCDGILLTDSSNNRINIMSDNHFIQQKHASSKRQKQWLRKSLSAMKDMTAPKPMKSRKSHDISNGNNGSFDDTISCSTANTGIVHVHHNGSKPQSELDWTDCNETINIISCPLPKSNRKNKKKNRENKKKKRKISADDEEIVFSDWSNVSSNIGVTTPITSKN